MKVENSLSSLIGKASRLLSNQITKNLAKHQVTSEQWAILDSLWENDGQTQQQLANLTHKNKASITHLIDNLEKRKLVKRVIHEKDRRNKIIHLTEDGNALRVPIRKEVKKTIKQYTKGLDKKDLKVCRKTLKKLIHNIIED